MPSLKQFHILFVLVSMALSLFLAYWTYNHDSQQYFYLSIIALLAVGFYGFKFYGKIQELNL
tara:strand:+ start:48 stop:233 length:186 start_codon:yes stop_codon:yes gene_type:complete